MRSSLVKTRPHGIVSFRAELFDSAQYYCSVALAIPERCLGGDVKPTAHQRSYLATGRNSPCSL